MRYSIPSLSINIRVYLEVLFPTRETFDTSHYNYYNQSEKVCFTWDNNYFCQMFSTTNNDYKRRKIQTIVFLRQILFSQIPL